MGPWITQISFTPSTWFPPPSVRTCGTVTFALRHGAPALRVWKKPPPPAPWGTPSEPGGRSCTFLTACRDTQQGPGGTDGDWAVSGGPRAGPVQRAPVFIHFLEGTTSEGPSVTAPEGDGGPGGPGVTEAWVHHPHGFRWRLEMPLPAPPPAELSPDADEGAALLRFHSKRNIWKHFRCFTASTKGQIAARKDS